MSMCSYLLMLVRYFQSDQPGGSVPLAAKVSVSFVFLFLFFFFERGAFL